MGVEHHREAPGIINRNKPLAARGARHAGLSSLAPANDCSDIPCQRRLRQMSSDHRVCALRGWR